MTARSVYFAATDVKALLRDKNAFFKQYNIQADDHSLTRLFTDISRWNSDKKIYEIFLTVNLPIATVGRDDMVDNQRFNVATEEEQKEQAVPMPA